ncbi:unnamed protein product [Mycena citricolor]|uniref:DUF6699 domain-containing protein n=1 Tax=Mycena citricolor TaxID=2018698 RepID=A0AAD2HYI3_9AGAR|nr:unnamed protein product [Mycena citricolor]
MSGPFVYVPEEDPSSPLAAGAAALPPCNFYPSPHGGPSPFLPPSPFLSSSPYLGYTPLAPSDTPLPRATTVQWADQVPTRQRTTSWQGPAPQQGGASPFLQPTTPAFVQSHQRSVSWGSEGAPPRPAWIHSYSSPAPPQWNPQSQPPPSQDSVHPFLNGDAPSPYFFFDLAPARFSPLKMTAPDRGAPLDAADFAIGAFHPARTDVRILHPDIPFWPVDLRIPDQARQQYQQRNQLLPPIALGDVLVSLHRALHTRIDATDWEMLPRETQARVAAAFTKRCRAEAVRSGAPPAQLRDSEMRVRTDGVKRVDFLLGKTVVKGLVKDRQDPVGCLRLVTA